MLTGISILMAILHIISHKNYRHTRLQSLVETTNYQEIKICLKKQATIISRPSTSENQWKLYPPERKLTKANQPSLNLKGGAQDEI